MGPTVDKSNVVDQPPRILNVTKPVGDEWWFLF